MIHPTKIRMNTSGIKSLMVIDLDCKPTTNKLTRTVLTLKGLKDV